MSKFSAPLLNVASAPCFALGHLFFMFGRDSLHISFADILYVAGIAALEAHFVSLLSQDILDANELFLPAAGFALTNAFSHFLSCKWGFLTFGAWAGCMLLLLHGARPFVEGLPEIKGSLDLSYLATDYMGGEQAQQFAPYLEDMPYHALPMASTLLFLSNCWNFMCRPRTGGSCTTIGLGLKMTASFGLVCAHTLSRNPERISEFTPSQVDAVFSAIMGFPVLWMLSSLGGSEVAPKKKAPQPQKKKQSPASSAASSTHSSQGKRRGKKGRRKGSQN